MSDIDFPIERLNKFLDNHVFEVKTFPTHGDDYFISTNVKVKITGIKNYISVGEDKPHVEYTLYVLPSNQESDMWNSLWSKHYGSSISINTSSQEYHQIRWVVSHLLSDFLKYFGVDMNTICTKVVNEVEPMKLNESIITEGKMNNIIRTVVRDIISIFKTKREGEFGLPEDLNKGEMVYDFPQLETKFSVFLDLQQDDTIDGFETDGEFYSDDDLIYVTITSNPNVGNEILQELTGELNELIQHELVHIRQHEKEYEFPKDTKSSKKYYTQDHELEAQRKGFKRRAKQEKRDFESVVRNWFKKYPHKHKLNPKQMEYVIQRIISEK